MSKAKSKHVASFLHERLSLGGHFGRRWPQVQASERLVIDMSQRPLDRDLIKEASCAFGYRFRQKDDRDLLVGIHAPQLHKREMKGGVSSSGINCYWFTEEPLFKPRDILGSLEEAANKGDESAFLKNLQKVKWQDQTAADVVRAIKLAFRAGAFKAACHIASEGIKFHPDNVDVQKYARVLSPVVREPKTVPVPGKDTRTNRQWLKEHARRYRGKWVALRNGELLSASQSLDTLIEEVSKKHGITFPSKEVLITSGY